MRDYDPSLPLIALHVPKTAGISVKEIFKGWFGEGLLQHYSNGEKLPKLHDIDHLHSRQRPVVVYGHFNRRRRFGVEHYYPQAKQFVTILRDPFDRAVSGYFYACMNQHDAGLRASAEKGLEEKVMDPSFTMLNHFPCEITMENFQEVIETRFIEVGVTEQLDESMLRIAKRLGKPYVAGSLPHLNASTRGELIPDGLRERFREARRLDYAVYDYVRAKLGTPAGLGCTHEVESGATP